MNNIIYYNKFKEDLRKNNIEIIIDRYGFFKVVNDTDFLRLSSSEPIGLIHILNYDYIKISDDKYRLIRRLDSFSIQELEEDFINEIKID